VEIRFARYLVEGTVVDESGTPVDGAAVDIGGSAVVTDSRGRFFVRMSSRREIPVRVLLQDFLATGQYEVVTAPPTATPRLERQSTPLRIVVRRVLPGKGTSTPPPSARQPGEPNG
jgi:protocatechuate 3,4-dioxygenase beta subunit